MKTKASLAIPILLAVSLLLGASNALAGPFGEIVVFVDRLSDNGNDLLFDDLPVPDPEFYGEGQFSNGQVWVEYLTDICPNPDGSTFFLFHRPRRWNPRDRIWIGYER